MNRITTFLLTLVLLGACSKATGNNLSVSIDALKGTSALEVTISWSDSWKLDSVPPYNHDAVWLFVKYRASGQPWEHRKVSADELAYAHDSFIKPLTVEDEAGVFVRRNTPGTGEVLDQKLTIPFSESLPHQEFDFRVFGIEMVYVSEGPFYLGDGVSYGSYHEGGKEVPYFVENNGVIPTGNEAGQLYASGDHPPAGDIPEHFPNGFSGFYVMKHAITQEQYRDFLNSLTFEQQLNRTSSSPDEPRGTPALASSLHASRNNIAIRVSGSQGLPAIYGLKGENGEWNEQHDGRHRACNFLNYNDVAAYLAWAGLRPLTALEYEKASRGPLNPVPGEFAWGTPYIINAETLIDDGTNAESVTESATDSHGLALHGYDGVRGALRAGFAGPGVTGRVATGSSYYGAFDLSGNLWETVIVTNVSGLNFTGKPGSGNLTEDGFATESGWPDHSSSGSGYRGGGWNSGIYPPGSFRDLAVSDRFYGFSPAPDRRNTSGGRGAR